MDTERAAGILLGLACGDALGRPVEFRSAASIERAHGTVREMLGHGTHGQPAGTITDDTELALCLARSLVELSRFDPDDIGQRFVDWLESGPFDVGLMTADAIRHIRDGTAPETAGRRVWEARSEGSNAGNGSVMRCAPHAIAYADHADRLAEVSERSSTITHADPRCTAGCAVLNLTLAGLARDDADPLTAALDRVDAPGELHDALVTLPTRPSTLRSSGYVVHTLQTALYHGLTAESAEEGIVAAVNMGEDTDTVGAVTGAVVGARFGASDLPDRWVETVGHTTELRELGEQLATGTFD
ncbi:ADP-ribosylglycohydrolase family protein [Halorarius litoreus]|uniref:ADP-ribosylglycohydrolase family protein n=1 Tax=Halorarius litoreus TaxID=2962676 RepID=UPI0020CBADE3|nr:ADP-ribosylglycohydrolase family protein [Halorarius litoreus]